MRPRTHLVAMIAATLLSGCYNFRKPAVGYDGPELPPSEISFVLAPSNVIGGSVVSIDGRVPNENGIYLLPGKHTFEFRYMHTGLGETCTSEPIYDYSKLYYCQKRKDVYCTANAGTKYHCQVGARPASCTGSFTTLPQRKYHMSIVIEYGEDSNDHVPKSIDVYDLAGGPDAMVRGAGKCNAGHRQKVFSTRKSDW